MNEYIFIEKNFCNQYSIVGEDVILNIIKTKCDNYFNSNNILIPDIAEVKIRNNLPIKEGDQIKVILDTSSFKEESKINCTIYDNKNNKLVESSVTYS